MLVSFLAYSLTQKIEATFSFKMPIDFCGLHGGKRYNSTTVSLYYSLTNTVLHTLYLYDTVICVTAVIVASIIIIIIKPLQARLGVV
jgi:hypothetical protein